MRLQSFRLCSTSITHIRMARLPVRLDSEKIRDWEFWIRLGYRSSETNDCDRVKRAGLSEESSCSGKKGKKPMSAGTKQSQKPPCCSEPPHVSGKKWRQDDGEWSDEASIQANEKFGEQNEPRGREDLDVKVFEERRDTPHGFPGRPAGWSARSFQLPGCLAAGPTRS